jgi:hypothetical protein
MVVTCEDCLIACSCYDGTGSAINIIFRPCTSRQVRDELEHLLDADVDMAAMHLSDKLAADGQSSRCNTNSEPNEFDEERYPNKAGDNIYSLIYPQLELEQCLCPLDQCRSGNNASCAAGTEKPKQATRAPRAPMAAGLGPPSASRPKSTSWRTFWRPTSCRPTAP